MPPKKKKDESLSQTSPSASLADPEEDLFHKPLSSDMQAFLACITNSFTTSFNTCVDKIIDGLDKRLNQKIDSQSVDIFDLNKRCERLEKANKDLASENSTLKDLVKSLSNKIDSLTQNVDDLEQYSKGTNLLIHGIPTHMSADGSTEINLETRVVDYLNNNLNVSLSDNEVSAIHRLNRNTASSSTRQPSASTQRPAPILVQFCNRKARNNVLSKRKLLKGKNVAITEQLTTKRTQLLKKANDLVTNSKLSSAWTHEGRVLARTSENKTITLTFSNIDQF